MPGGIQRFPDHATEVDAVAWPDHRVRKEGIAALAGGIEAQLHPVPVLQPRQLGHWFGAE